MTADKNEARKKYLREYMKEWRKNNPEKKRAENKRYRDRKKNDGKPSK